MLGTSSFTLDCIIIIVVSVLSRSVAYKTNFTEGEVNKTYLGTVDNNVQFVFRYNINSSDILHNTYYRVQVSSSPKKNIIKSCPTLFVFRLGDHVGSIQLPHEHLSTKSYFLYNSNRTLCTHSNHSETSVYKEIFVTVSSCDPTDINFTLVISENYGYTINLAEKKQISGVTVISPVFYHFTFPEDVDFVTILVNSSTKSRTYVSIQNATCPVYDEISNIRSVGRFRSMSMRTSITVLKTDFPEGSFHLVFLPDQNIVDIKLLRANPSLETIEFQIVTSDANVPIALSVPLAIYLGIILGTFLLYSYSHYLYIRKYRTDQWAPQTCLDNCCNFNVFDTKLRVLDLTKDENLHQYLKRAAYRYIWTMLIIFIYFVLPVCLLGHYLNTLMKESGDLDRCNSNQYCSYPFLNISNFNHLFSGIGFPIFGLTFIAFVKKRATKLMVNDQVSGVAEDNIWCFKGVFNFAPISLTKTGYGAYQNFGIYYTLGTALIATGVLKMVYNSCPTRDTSFFGTSFMYVIVLLSEIKIYNLRHPCIITDNFTFGVIAVVLVLVTFGYLMYNFQVVQIIISVFLSFFLQLSMLILHSAGYAKRSVVRANPTAERQNLLNEVDGVNVQEVETEVITSPKSLFCNIFYHLKVRDLFLPFSFVRVFWPILRLIVNVAILYVIWDQMPGKNFITRTYVIFLVNFLLDFIYYFVIMKCSFKEYDKKISWQPVVSLTLALAGWAFSLYFMVIAFSNWERPSIYLPEHYQGCIALKFYDFSDMYKLTIAPTLFFTFMVMLTADDALSRTSCEMVPVF